MKEGLNDMICAVWMTPTLVFVCEWLRSERIFAKTAKSRDAMICDAAALQGYGYHQLLHSHLDAFTTLTVDITDLRLTSQRRLLSERVGRYCQVTSAVRLFTQGIFMVDAISF